MYNFFEVFFKNGIFNMHNYVDFLLSFFGVFCFFFTKVSTLIKAQMPPKDVWTRMGKNMSTFINTITELVYAFVFLVSRFEK